MKFPQPERKTFLSHIASPREIGDIAAQAIGFADSVISQMKITIIAEA